MKTKEELNALREEVEALNKKLAELSEDELAQVTGGAPDMIDINGLEAIGPYAVAAQNGNTRTAPGSYSEAERELIPENTETVFR